jgi:hypothetical protein
MKRIKNCPNLSLLQSVDTTKTVYELGLVDGSSPNCSVFSHRLPGFYFYLLPFHIPLDNILVSESWSTLISLSKLSK